MPTEALREQAGVLDSAPPTVSAVIPAYNAAETIERALDSVYAQTYDNIIEVIVVDDGSEDTTADTVREKYPGVTLIEQENAGNAAARNRGVEAATGEFIAFLDADDEWLPEKIERQIEILFACVGAMGVISKERHVYPDGRVAQGWESDTICHYSFRDWASQLPLRMGFTTCFSGWVVRTARFRQAGGLADEFRQCVDTEAVLRFSALGFTLIGLPQVLFVRHLQPTSVSRGAAANIREGRIARRILTQYAPDQPDVWGRLMERDEYRRKLKGVLLAASQSHARAGEIAEARKLAREARAIGRTKMVRDCAAVALSIAPGLVAWFTEAIWVPLRRFAALRRARPSNATKPECEGEDGR